MRQLLIFLIAFTLFAEAQEHIVQMMDKGDKYYKQFQPIVLFIEVGDTVLFKTNGYSGHNSQSIEGMIPNGQKGWKGGIGKEATVKFEKEGFYGYKCFNHYTMGMVGAIIVGKADNINEAKTVKHTKLSEMRFKTIFEEIEKSDKTVPTL